ncbi:MAG: 4Fe-4S dicluster domain-containing protein [Candidatus Omnitrophica bacterium]|nr:4Fe-4S dicluster domain-containing protein [Candidatus Omnitrophota bacterium]MDD5660786.1 4Fe-4S dicluster domain-containing protein [Candidatus Omnitrophota bacterium]
MAKIIINQDRCKGCLLCISACPKGLIKKSAKLNKKGLNFVEFDFTGGCIGCMQCAVMCPDCCIEVYK